MLAYTYFRGMRFPYNVIQFFKDMQSLAKWSIQKLYRGYADYEVWAFNTVLAEFAIPRLKRLKLIQHGIPASIWSEGKPEKQAIKEWHGILDKMIKAFELIAYDDDWEFDGEKGRQVNEGLDLFREYFFALWD